MKKIFIGLMLMFTLSAPVLAGTAIIPGWEELSDQQKAQITLDAANKAAQAKAMPVKAADLEEWVNLGKSIGVGFAATATELGMGIDELMHTDTGKLAMFVIVWNYVGDKFVGILGGILWFSIMLPSWAYYFRRWTLVPTWEWHDNGKKKSLTYVKNRSSDAVAYFTIAMVAILAAGFLMIFAS